MKVAVINEVSACAKNPDIISALKEQDGIEILNVGMKNPTEENPITYIQTGIMSAVLLNYGLSDMVVGGCGTGQGYINSVMQFPNVFCGLIQEPLDAWLFSQINGGNCISLALNKGYGWAADINLKYIFEKLFKDPAGNGYPVARQESQKQSREILKTMSVVAHKSMLDIVKSLDADIVKPISKRDDFMMVLKASENAEVKNLVEYINSL